jgi:hypothetical protein
MQEIIIVSKVSNTEERMTVFQQDIGLPNMLSFLGWEFMTLAGITVSSLRFKKMVKLCRIK